MVDEPNVVITYTVKDMFEQIRADIHQLSISVSGKADISAVAQLTSKVSEIQAHSSLQSQEAAQKLNSAESDRIILKSKAQEVESRLLKLETEQKVAEAISKNNKLLAGIGWKFVYGIGVIVAFLIAHASIIFYYLKQGIVR